MHNNECIFLFTLYKQRLNTNKLFKNRKSCFISISGASLSQTHYLSTFTVFDSLKPNRNWKLEG